jgi:hypothetical protein
MLGTVELCIVAISWISLLEKLALEFVLELTDISDELYMNVRQHTWRAATRKTMDLAYMYLLLSRLLFEATSKEVFIERGKSRRSELKVAGTLTAFCLGLLVG